MIDLSEVEKIYPLMVEYRRHIHENPELGMDTSETKNYVKKLATDLGFVIKEVGNGLIIDSGKSPKIALRADMDSLPIIEETGLAFSSKSKGKMHACGHDLHTSALMGAMIYCKRMSLRPVRFIFQPGEEIGQGASMMIEGGAMEGISNTFGLHSWPSLNVGEYSICKGKAMAAVDTFEIKVKGAGGHGAYPHLAYDTVLEASRIIQNLLTVPARKVDPLNSAVLSIGYVNGGKAKNIIPAEVDIGGTVRTYTREDSEIIEREVTKLKGEHVEVTYVRELPPLVNDEKFARVVDSVASKYVKQVNANPTMGGEDFAFYCSRVPSAFAFLGTGKIQGKEVSKHSSVFDINEEALKYGLLLHLSAIEAISP
ncbi:MAG: M20 family metallopeptidase [Candidatus Thermoplasmatota archaeon]|nr:M20 family metallopeptidase [Candidatus Thermoplasmatota archaeon]